MAEGCEDWIPLTPRASTRPIVADKIRRQGAGGALWSDEANGLTTTLSYDLSGNVLSRKVMDGSTPVMKREVAAMDRLGKPTDVDGLSASYSEELAYWADRHFLTQSTQPTA